MIGHVSVLLNVFGDAVMETCLFEHCDCLFVLGIQSPEEKSHGFKVISSTVIMGLTNTLTNTKGLSVGLFDFTGK